MHASILDVVSVTFYVVVLIGCITSYACLSVRLSCVDFTSKQESEKSKFVRVFHRAGMAGLPISRLHNAVGGLAYLGRQ